jgi:hypothetical protein
MPNRDIDIAKAIPLLEPVDINGWAVSCPFLALGGTLGAPNIQKGCKGLELPRCIARDGWRCVK